MCYSGKCKYEYHNGNCSIFCTEEYYKNLGVSPCVVGGFTRLDTEITEEEKQKLDDKARELKLLYK